jgi:hypothetical protein
VVEVVELLKLVLTVDRLVPLEMVELEKHIQPQQA